MLLSILHVPTDGFQWYEMQVMCHLLCCCWLWYLGALQDNNKWNRSMYLSYGDKTRKSQKQRQCIIWARKTWGIKWYLCHCPRGEHIVCMAFNFLYSRLCTSYKQSPTWMNDGGRLTQECQLLALHEAISYVYKQHLIPLMCSISLKVYNIDQYPRGGVNNMHIRNGPHSKRADSIYMHKCRFPQWTHRNPKLVLQRRKTWQCVYRSWCS